MASELKKYSKKDLKRVCVAVGLCKTSDDLTKKDLRLMLKKNRKDVKNKLGGMNPPQSGDVVASPFCAPIPSPFCARKSPFNNIVNQIPISIPDPPRDPRDCLFDHYQESYDVYFKEGNFPSDFDAKSTAADIALSFKYPLKQQAAAAQAQGPVPAPAATAAVAVKEVPPANAKEGVQPAPAKPKSPIRMLNNSANAVAFIYPMEKWACFLKVQNQGRCDDSYDRIETDCIVSRLLRNISRNENQSLKERVGNFLPILTSYILPNENEGIQNMIENRGGVPLQYYKTMSIPMIFGDSLLNIFKNELSKSTERPGVYFNKENLSIVTIKPQGQDRTEKGLTDLLYELFVSMSIIYDEIGLIHNDAHLGNIFYDKMRHKLVLIDYGRSAFKIDQSTKPIIESEVKKLNFSDITGKYPSYPRQFLNMYTIYYSEHDGDKIPLYMNDIATISYNIYKVLREKNVDVDIPFMSFSKICETIKVGDKTRSVPKIHKVNFFDLDQFGKTPLRFTNKTIHSILQPGLYWLANYVKRFEEAKKEEEEAKKKEEEEAKKQVTRENSVISVDNINISTSSQETVHGITFTYYENILTELSMDISHLCGGYPLSPLLENGVFNSLSFDKKYCGDCTIKTCNKSHTQINASERKDSDFFMTCAGKSQGGGGGEGSSASEENNPSTEKNNTCPGLSPNCSFTDEMIEEMADIFKNRLKLPDEPLNQTLDNQYTPTNQPIIIQEPSTPQKPRNGFSFQDDKELQKRFDCRMKKLENLFNSSS